MGQKYYHENCGGEVVAFAEGKASCQTCGETGPFKQFYSDERQRYEVSFLIDEQVNRYDSLPPRQ